MYIIYLNGTIIHGKRKQMKTGQNSHNNSNFPIPGQTDGKLENLVWSLSQNIDTTGFDRLLESLQRILTNLFESRLRSTFGRKKNSIKLILVVTATSILDSDLLSGEKTQYILVKTNILDSTPADSTEKP